MGMVEAVIWGALRVKNEAEWIERVIRAAQQICTDIFVFDDHSTDGTDTICTALGCTVLPSIFTGLDEVRDKNALLNFIVSKGTPDWIFWPDGDEELQKGAAPILVDWMDANPQAVSGRMRVAYLWDSEQIERVDRWYSDVWMPRLFKFKGFENRRFRPTRFGGNFHCSSAPGELAGNSINTPLKLWHYGYMERRRRLEKWAWYNQHDPNNEHEDYYLHMIVGDVPSLPANAECKWAGPLVTQPRMEV